MDRERPRGREKNVTGQGTGLGRRGSGLGTGPVGSQDGYSGKGSGSGGGGRRITRGAGLSLPVIILAIIVYMLGGGNLLGGSGGGSSVSYDYGSANESSGGSFGGLFGDSSSGRGLLPAAPPEAPAVPGRAARLSIRSTARWRPAPARNAPRSSETARIPLRSWSTCAARTWSPAAGWRPATCRRWSAQTCPTRST